MKKFLFINLLSFISLISAFSQVPDAFNYQAVVRNSSGEIIANQNVSFKISILQNSDTGTAVYVETHSATTNKFGLVNLKIGQGNIESGIFDPGDWGSNKHFIKVEFDPTGKTSFTLMGTSQLLSVPYAFHAQTVAEDHVNDADANPQNEIQTLDLSGTQLSLSQGGGTVTLPSSGGGDNWGTQTVTSDATLSGEGSTASPLSVVGDLTDDQSLSLSGSNLSISGGNTVALPAASGSDNWGTQTVETDATIIGDGTIANPLSAIDGDVTNEIQLLTKTGNSIELSNGGGTVTDEVDDADADITNEIQTLDLSGTQLSLSQGGGTVTLPSSGGGDNWGMQTVASDATLSGIGTTASPLSVVGDLTDDQSLSLSGSNLSISGGNTIDLLSGTGDNWGMQTVASDATLIGNGTTAGPLKVADGAITTAKLANNAVSIAKLPAGASATTYLRGDGSWQIPATGSASPWTTNLYGVGYFNNVGIGGGYAENTKFFVYSPLNIAIQGTASAATGTNYAGKFLTNSPDGYSGHFTGGKFYVSGNVGIGTEAPTSLLDLNSHANNAYLTFHSDNTSAGGLIVGIKQNNNNAYIFNYENAPLIFGTNGSLQMTITKLGKVGIGTSTPSQKLQIVGGSIQLDEGKELRIYNTSYYSKIGTDGISTQLTNFSGGSISLQTGASAGIALTRLTVASDGNVGIGNENPSSKLDVNGVIRATGNVWPSTGEGVEIAYNASLKRGYIQCYDRGDPFWGQLFLGAGEVSPGIDNFTWLGTSTHRWLKVYAVNGTIQTSDRRMKKDIKDLNYGLNTVLQLRPVSYRWKKGNQNLNLGLIAQEVQKLIPEVVDVGDDEIKTLGMKYTDLIPVLINAIKEQQKIISSQNTKINGLTAEVALLKTMDQRLKNLEATLNTAQK